MAKLVVTKKWLNLNQCQAVVLLVDKIFWESLVTFVFDWESSRQIQSNPFGKASVENKFPYFKSFNSILHMTGKLGSITNHTQLPHFTNFTWVTATKCIIKCHIKYILASIWCISSKSQNPTFICVSLKSKSKGLTKLMQ